MVTQLHSSVGQEQGRHDTQHSSQFVSINVESWREEQTNKLGAVVVVQNCACEDESEGVESLCVDYEVYYNFILVRWCVLERALR
jgi:hypothetical protein